LGFKQGVEVKRHPELVFKIFLFLLFSFLVFLPLFSQSAKLSPEAELTSNCMECHEGMDNLLAETPHRILVSPEGKQVRNSPLNCKDCHSNWERHLEEPGLGNIGNPEKMDAFENFKLCTTCHFNPHVQELSEFNVHFRNKISCSDCHSVHRPEAEHLLVKSSNDLCLECHQEIETKLSLVSHHPVGEKVIKCVDCHQVLGEPGKDFSVVSPNRKCYSCHPEFEGPFPFEHEALNDYTIQEGSCASCHQSHGSKTQNPSSNYSNRGLHQA
jgi:DmsE family decaheme c-type cytochrome